MRTRYLLLLPLVCAWAVFVAFDQPLCRVPNESVLNQPPPPGPPAWAYWNGSSYLPHTPSNIPVFLTASVKNWDADFQGHYDNAVGFWNSVLPTTVFVNLTQDGVLTRTWVVKAGSADETVINDRVTALGQPFQPVPTCGGSGWANVYPAYLEPVDGHDHYRYQKICIYGGATPTATKANNSQGYHYWWLMFTHELSHVLSIDDFQSGACVTLQGVSMQYPCANEIAFIRDHYGL